MRGISSIGEGENWKPGGFDGFQSKSPYYYGAGPYDYFSLRYYLAFPNEQSLLSENGGRRGSSEKMPRPASPGSDVAGDSDESLPHEEASEPENKLLPSITTKFLSGSGYCGDSVQIQITGENLPARPSARIDLKSDQDGSLVESINRTMEALPFQTKWIARKKGPLWDSAEILLFAEAAGAKAQDGNKFNIKRIPDYAKETKTIQCTSGIFGWTGKFEIGFTDGILHVTTKVKLMNRLGAKPAPGDPMPVAGTPVSDRDKAEMKKDIESKLTGKWFLHRRSCERNKKCDCEGKNGCCKFRVRVYIEFVESGEHHVVNLFQGPGRANASNWTRVKTRANSWAHETGHLLAWFDEYDGGAVCAAPRWKTPNDTAVMSSGLKVPFEYYWDFRDWLKGKSSQDLDGID